MPTLPRKLLNLRHPEAKRGNRALHLANITVPPQNVHAVIGIHVVEVDQLPPVESLKVVSLGDGRSLAITKSDGLPSSSPFLLRLRLG